MVRTNGNGTLYSKWCVRSFIWCTARFSLCIFRVCTSVGFGCMLKWKPCVDGSCLFDGIWLFIWIPIGDRKADTDDSSAWDTGWDVWVLTNCWWWFDDVSTNPKACVIEGDCTEEDISNCLTDGDTNVIPDSWNTLATLAGGSRSVFIRTVGTLTGGSNTVFRCKFTTCGGCNSVFRWSALLQLIIANISNCNKKMLISRENILYAFTLILPYCSYW